jgi:hypothetical protein
MDRDRRWVIERIEALPHWARVAFAARCGRRVLPLFARYWVDVPPGRVASLAEALDLAERSAAEGRSLAGLKEASVSATIAAGAAQRGLYRTINDERAPTDRRAAWIAVYVAKAVEWAATAAAAAPGESANPTLEAFVWAHDAAYDAEDIDILDGLDGDLEALSRVVDRGRWTSQTPVPPEVFGLLSGTSEAPKPR